MCSNKKQVCTVNSAVFNKKSTAFNMFVSVNAVWANTMSDIIKDDRWFVLFMLCLLFAKVCVCVPVRARAWQLCRCFLPVLLLPHVRTCLPDTMTARRRAFYQLLPQTWHNNKRPTANWHTGLQWQGGVAVCVCVCESINFPRIFEWTLLKGEWMNKSKNR